jgi:hypothetical protein
MSKFERRFERGIINLRDVEKQISRNLPKETYQIVEKFWQSHEKPPEIKVVYETTQSDKEYLKNGYVPLEIKDIKNVKRSFDDVGRKISGDNVLRTMLASRYTIYMSFCLVPENFDHEFSFCDSETCNQEKFNNSVSINSQVRAIGELGTRAIGRHLGIYDPLTDYKAIKFAFERGEERSRVSGTQLKKIERKAKFIGQKSANIRKISMEEKEDRKNLGIYGALDAAIAGCAILFVADSLEREFKDRFPQLIRKTLEPEKKYVNYFVRFVKEYMSSFGVILEGRKLI